MNGSEEKAKKSHDKLTSVEGFRHEWVMPRQVRIEFAGAMYHVMTRGDRREAIVQDDEDRGAFLRTLGEGDGLEQLAPLQRSSQDATRLAGNRDGIFGDGLQGHTQRAERVSPNAGIVCRLEESRPGGSGLF